MWGGRRRRRRRSCRRTSWSALQRGARCILSKCRRCRQNHAELSRILSCRAGRRIRRNVPLCARVAADRAFSSTDFAATSTVRQTDLRSSAAMSSDLPQRLETMACGSLSFPTEAYGAATQAYVAAIHGDNAAQFADTPQRTRILLHSDSVMLQYHSVALQRESVVLQYAEETQLSGSTLQRSDLALRQHLLTLRHRQLTLQQSLLTLHRRAFACLMVEILCSKALKSCSRVEPCDPESPDVDSKSLHSAAQDGSAIVRPAAMLQNGGTLRQNKLEMQQRILRMQQNLQASRGDEAE